MTSAELENLITALSETNDKIRYAAFLTVQDLSRKSNEIYPYFDLLIEKLNSDNSYQRSIGIMLIAENIKWDKENKCEKIMEQYLSHTQDEKFITSRQTIQSINAWIMLKPNLFSKVIEKLIQIDISKLKDSQRKSILLDILSVLTKIYEVQKDNRIFDYFMKAMTGGILDAKQIKQLKSLIA